MHFWLRLWILDFGFENNDKRSSRHYCQVRIKKKKTNNYFLMLFIFINRMFVNNAQTNALGSREARKL